MKTSDESIERVGIEELPMNVTCSDEDDTVFGGDHVSLDACSPQPQPVINIHYRPGYARMIANETRVINEEENDEVHDDKEWNDMFKFK